MNVLLVCTISVFLALKPRNGISGSKEICLFKFADNLKLFLESSLPVYTMTSIVHMYTCLFASHACQHLVQSDINFCQPRGYAILSYCSFSL